MQVLMVSIAIFGCADPHFLAIPPCSELGDSDSDREFGQRWLSFEAFGHKNHRFTFNVSYLSRLSSTPNFSSAL